MGAIQHDTVVSVPFTPIPNELLRDRELSARDILVYSMMRSHKSGWRQSVRQLAESVGMTQVTVRAALKVLIARGWVLKIDDGWMLAQERGEFNSPTTEAQHTANATTAATQSPASDEPTGPSELKTNPPGGIKINSQEGLKINPHNKNNNKTKNNNPPGLQAALPPEGIPATPAQPTPTKPTKGTHLPDGWMPTHATVEAMRSQFPHLTPQQFRQIHDEFTDYFTSVTGWRATKKNWDATWRNWVRRAASERRYQPQQPTGYAGGGMQAKMDNIAASLAEAKRLYGGGAA